MKSLFLSCFLFCSIAYANNFTQQISNLLKEDSDTIFKYAAIGILQETLFQKENEDEKTVRDTKILIETLRYSSLQQTNVKLNGQLDDLIKFIEFIAFKNQDAFIKYVFIGKRIAQ